MSRWITVQVKLKDGSAYGSAPPVPDYNAGFANRDLVAPADSDPAEIGREVGKLVAEMVGTVARVTEPPKAITRSSAASAAAKPVESK